MKFFQWINITGAVWALTALLGGMAVLAQENARFVTGGLLSEIWLDIPGAQLSDLTNHVRFAQPPDSTSLAAQFELARPLEGDGLDNFGARLSGYLYAPLSGDYVFYLASDDQGALFLSADEDPENKRQIAFEPFNGGMRQWTGDAGGQRNANLPENVSAPIHLESHRWYYVEALVKEGGRGGDYLGVTWQAPGDEPVRIGDLPIPGMFLATFADGSLGGGAPAPNAPPPLALKPKIVFQPEDRTALAGETVSFLVEAEGGAPFQYQWRFNGSPLAGQTKSTLLLGNVAPHQEGVYSVEVTNSNEERILSRGARLIVLGPLASLETVLTDQADAGGEGVFDPVAVTFTPPWGDGRDRRAGFVLNSDSSFESSGAIWEFNYRRSDTGIQLLHPFGDGQVVLTIHRDSIGLSVPERWVAIGYGPGDVSGIAHTVHYDSIFPLVDGRTYHIKSIASPVGNVYLYVDGLLIGTGSIQETRAIDFTVNPGETFPGASSSSMEPFSGRGFPVRWEKGYAGIILEPVDQGMNQISQVRYSPGPSDPPTIIEPPRHQTAIRGDDVTFTVSAMGEGQLEYQWYFGDMALVGETEATFTLVDVVEAQSGDYRAGVRNGPIPEILSETANLTVGPPLPPSIAQDLEDATVDARQPVEFEVKAGGTPPFEYQWYFNGGILAGQTESILRLASASPSEAGEYFVVVSNPSEFTAASRTAQLTVIVPQPPVFVQEPQDTDAVWGKPVEFTVTVEGSRPIQYEWFFNGTPIPGADRETLRIANASNDHKGQYSVRVSNRTGAVKTSRTAVLTVNLPPLPSTPPDILAYWDFNDASDSSRSIDLLNGYAGTFLNGVAYTESGGGWSGESGDRAADFGIADNDKGIRMESMASALREAALEDQLTVAFWQKWNVPIVAPSSSLWIETPGAPALQASAPDADGDVVANFSGCRLSEPVRSLTSMDTQMFFQDWRHFAFVKNGSLAQVWIDGVLFNQAIVGCSLPVNITGLMVGNGWDLDSQFLARVDDLAVFGSALEPASIIALSQGVPPLKVAIPAPPVIASEPQDLTVEWGESAVFEAAAEISSPLPLKYQWFKGPSAIPGATGASLRIDNATTLDEGQYRVRATALSGESATSRNARLTVLPPPAPVIEREPEDTTAARGQRVEFSVAAAGTAPLAYQWFLGGVSIPGANGATLTIENVQFFQAGEYFAIVTDAAGGFASSRWAQLTVVAAEAPTLVEEPPDLAVNWGETAVFQISVEGTAPFEYQWFFNGEPLADKTSDVLRVVNAATANAGAYSATVSNIAGEVSTREAVLTVNPPPPPLIVEHPADAVVETGGAAAFEVAASGIGPFEYQWYLNAELMLGEMNRVLRLTNLTENRSGDYSVEVTNPSGEFLNSEPANLLVRPPRPPVVLSQPEDAVVDAGSTVEMNVEAAGSEPLSYQWFFEGQPLEGAAGAGLSLEDVSIAQLGLYQVEIGNAYGTVSSQETILAVNHPDQPSPNDSFGNPRVLSGIHARSVNSNANATRQTAEPEHAPTAGDRSVWWTWTAPRDAHVVLTTRGSEIDTVLAVYRGSSLEQLILTASNDDDPDGGTHSRVEFEAEAGIAYHIAVDGYGDEAGLIALELSANLAAPRLSFELSGRNLIINWPAGLAGFRLETADRIDAPNWTLMEAGVTIVNESKSLKVPPDERSRYFRLRED